MQYKKSDHVYVGGRKYNRYKIRFFKAMKYNKFNNLAFYNINRFAQLRIIIVNVSPPSTPRAENLQKKLGTVNHLYQIRNQMINTTTHLLRWLFKYNSGIN